MLVEMIFFFFFLVYSFEDFSWWTYGSTSRHYIALCPEIQKSQPIVQLDPTEFDSSIELLVFILFWIRQEPFYLFGLMKQYFYSCVFFNLPLVLRVLSSRKWNKSSINLKQGKE